VEGVVVKAVWQLPFFNIIRKEFMKFIELFAGIGGFRYGLENITQLQTSRGTSLQHRGDSIITTITDGEQSKRQFTCVYANEWDKYASSIYRYHYGEIDTRDICTVNEEEIPDHELLVGGFPCQAFSIAGKRGGFNDTRGTLFFEIARILQCKRPRYLLLENVKGLLSHESGKTFQTILGVLTDIGYLLQWEVVNSKNFGVPQNRERVFIIGHLRGERRPEVFPIRESNRNNYGQNKELSMQVSNTLRTNYSNGFSNETYIEQINSPIHSNNRLYSQEGLSPSLNTAQGGNRQPKIINKIGKTKNKDYASTLSGGAHSGGNHSDMDLLINENKIRRLTPIECERLQGFPDNWTKYGTDNKGNQIEISDTQRYKCLGNAVTTNVITAIGERLLNVTKL
jgi:DNA (cytosine-5)-methyltransferase 1